MNLKPMQQIVITKGNNTYRTGSKGIMLCKFIYGSCNIWDYYVLITRIGKSGKNRLSPVVLRLNQELPEWISEDDKDIINIVKVTENLEPAYPAGRAILSDIKIDPLKYECESKDLMDMNGWELVSYVTATSIFLSIIMDINNNRHNGARTSYQYRIPTLMIDSNVLNTIGNTDAEHLHKITINASNKCSSKSITQEDLIYSVEESKHLILHKLIKEKSKIANFITKYTNEDEKFYDLMENRVFNVIETYRQYKNALETIKVAGSLQTFSPLCKNPIEVYQSQINIARVKKAIKKRNRGMTVNVNEFIEAANNNTSAYNTAW